MKVFLIVMIVGLVYVNAEEKSNEATEATDGMYICCVVRYV